MPSTGIEWVRTLFERAQKTREPTCTRALFELILCGGFRGKEVDRRYPERVDLFLCAKRVANAEERTLYYRCIAFVVSQNLDTDFLLPDALKNKPWIQPFLDVGLDQNLDNHICWQLAYDFRCQTQKDRMTTHTFLVLWLFWIFRNEPLLPRLKVDLLNMGESHFHALAKEWN